MFLEVIAKDLCDVQVICESNADRIELCGAMEADGLTPDLKLIEQAAAIATKPIRVMIRNHNKGFYFTSEEVEVMKAQITQINLVPNIEGYVIGALTKTGELDEAVMSELIAAAAGRKITCHKACEAVISPQTLITLDKLGVNTVLTQGGLTPIDENYAILEQLVASKQEKDLAIEILIGGGVNYGNVKTLSQISPSIHVGKLVREDHNYDKLIIDEQIKQIKQN